MKNESWFLTKNNTSFDSEFDADSEYVYIFVKYFGEKNGLIDTCPFLSHPFDVSRSTASRPLISSATCRTLSWATCWNVLFVEL